MSNLIPNLNSSKQKKLQRLCAQSNIEAGTTLKYQRVLNVLTKGISDGVWEVGDKLPTEKELASFFSLSYGTIQKAYQILEDKGVVQRYRGSGSYVATTLQEMTKPWHCRFLDDENNILPVFPEIIGSAERTDMPDALKIFAKQKSMGRIDRKLHIGNEFIIFSRFYSTSDIIKSLLDLSKNISDGANFKSLLLYELGYAVVSIEQTIVQSRIDKQKAALLGCPPKALGLQIEAIGRDYSNLPIYYQVIDVPPTTRRLLFESSYQRNDVLASA